MKEYCVQIWGGAWNSDANPSIERDFGIEEGYYYFNDVEDMNKFLDILDKAEYKKQGICTIQRYGEMTYQRTMIIATFEYKGRKFIVHCDFGYEYPENQALNSFINGAYCNDLNRSLLIRKECGSHSIPKLSQTNFIKLKQLKIKYIDDIFDYPYCNPNLIIRIKTEGAY